MKKIFQIIMGFCYGFMVLIGSGILLSEGFGMDDCDHHMNTYLTSHSDANAVNDCTISKQNLADDCVCCSPNLFNMIDTTNINIHEKIYTVKGYILQTQRNKIYYYNQSYFDIAQPPD